MSWKFTKIRHKKQGKDKIQEDVRYNLFFDPTTERLRELTQAEEKSASFFMGQAKSERVKDKKSDLVEYVSRRVDDTGVNSTTDPRRH